MQPTTCITRLLPWCCINGIVSSLMAQCAIDVLAGDGLPGTSNSVNTVAAWDPDGSGPLPQRVLVGGRFAQAGTTLADGIAAWDPSTRTWSGFGSGLAGGSEIHCVLPLANGQMIAAGRFAAIGGLATFNIAMWSGTTWQALGAGLGSFSDRVYSLARLANGDVVAAGTFTTAGGVPASRIARWNGSSWSAIGTGVSSTAYALAILTNGDIVVGGAFPSAGAVTVGNLARWNGASWSPLGSGAVGTVYALAVSATGTLIAAGAFTSIGGVSASRIARWNGSSWSAFGTGLGGAVYSVAATGNGGVLAGGVFTTAGGQPANRVARWNGSAWAALGSGASDSVRGLAELGSGQVVAGGDFTAVGANPATYIASWNGVAWQRVSPGFDDTALAIAVAADGAVLVGGDFRSAGDVVTQRIARFIGGAWTGLGTGFPATFDQVRTIFPLPTGGVVVGGSFTAAGGVPANRIAQWNGVTWSALGSGLGGPVHSVARHSNGSLFVGGSFATAGGAPAANIARWDGTSWSPLGSGVNGLVTSVRVVATGDVIVCGSFMQAGGAPAANIARWDGAAWHALGSGLRGVAGLFGASVNAVTEGPNGDLVAVGSFSLAGGSSANNVARWNGSSWSPLGPGLVDMSTIGTNVTSVVTLPDGSLVAGGDFTHAGALPVQGLARWDGTSWHSFTGGVPFGVRSLAVNAAGELWVAGEFQTFAGQGVARLVRVGSSCGAEAVAFGSGCASSGGVNVLTAVVPPWVGGVFVSRAAGLPANGVGLAVLGTQQAATPLLSLLPQAGAGCLLLASPDRLDIVAMLAGVANVAIPVAPSPVLVGQVLYHQVAALELDVQANLIAVTTSNGLRLTVGIY